MPYPPWRRDLPGLMVGAPRERLRPLLPPFFEAGAARSSSFASSFACVSTRGALAAASHAALRPALAAARAPLAAAPARGRRRYGLAWGITQTLWFQPAQVTTFVQLLPDLARTVHALVRP